MRRHFRQSGNKALSRRIRRRSRKKSARGDGGGNPFARQAHPRGRGQRRGRILRRQSIEAAGGGHGRLAVPGPRRAFSQSYSESRKRNGDAFRLRSGEKERRRLRHHLRHRRGQGGRRRQKRRGNQPQSAHRAHFRDPLKRKAGHRRHRLGDFRRTCAVYCGARRKTPPL